MPIYEYQCEACGHKLEKIQKVSDELLTDCPECDAPRLKKLISAAGFRLKGSGWYETDFKSGSRKNVIGGESSSESSGGTDGGSDTGGAGDSGGGSKESDGNSKSSSDSVPVAAG